MYNKTCAHGHPLADEYFSHESGYHPPFNDLDLLCVVGVWWTFAPDKSVMTDRQMNRDYYQIPLQRRCSFEDVRRGLKNSISFQYMLSLCVSSLRKHACPNILKSSPPKTENIQIKKTLIYFIFLLETYIVGTL